MYDAHFTAYNILDKHWLDGVEVQGCNAVQTFFAMQNVKVEWAPTQHVLGTQIKVLETWQKIILKR